jgi:Transposase DDE domain
LTKRSSFEPRRRGREQGRGGWSAVIRRLDRVRAAVEREFGRLKNEYGLTPLRTRGLARVRLHADLMMIARLGQALARVRAVPLAA